MADTESGRPAWQRALPLVASVLAIVIGLLLIARPAFLSPSSVSSSAKPVLQGGTGGRMPKEGEQVPDFELKRLAGGTVKLADLRGSPVLINFWATWCGPCKQEMPLIVEQYNQNRGRGLRVLAIDTLANDSSVEDIRKFATQFNMNFDVLVDETDEVGAGWNILGLPTSFFVKPDGTVAKVKVGPMSADELRGYLKQIVPN